MTEHLSTIIEPISQIRERLEAKAGADAGTRSYWDCVAALLDVAEAAQRWALASTALGPEASDLIAALAWLDGVIGSANPQKADS